MRFKALLAVLLACVPLAMIAPQKASAFDSWHRHDRPAGWGHTRKVRHWVYYPRYHHVYLKDGRDDPYHYRYQPRGYYPYYNSRYWGRPRIRRHRAYVPPYYASWGAPRWRYRHGEWHRRHHGRHRHGHW